MRSMPVVLSMLAGSLSVPLAATVPFDVASGRPMVSVTVNGKGPYPFIFDTGSPRLLVMRELVEELGLEVVGQADVQSPLGGTPVKSDLVRVDSIALGGAEIHGLEATVLNMEGAGLGMGVVGPALFRELGALTLDFAADTVTFGGDETPGDIRTWLPFGDDAPLLNVPVRIGDVTLPGHLDTGSFDVVAVPTRFEQQLPLTGPARTIGHARTVDAEFEIRSAPIDGVALVGDARIPLHEVRIAPLPVVNVGTGALRGLRLYVDWKNERFALTGTAEPTTPQRAAHAAEPASPRKVVQAAPPGEGPRFGLRGYPTPQGVIEVAGVDAGSPAEAIGLRTGDRIVAINGNPPGGLEPTQIRAELAAPDLELTVEREGETIRLVR